MLSAGWLRIWRTVSKYLLELIVILGNYFSRVLKICNDKLMIVYFVLVYNLMKLKTLY